MSSRLLGLPLLHDAERQDWALWLQAQDVADLGQAASSGISFDDQTLLIRAAASHQGVALVTETLARPELEQGGLVRVLDVAWPQEFSYWLACPRATAEQPKIVAFRDWLLTEGRRVSANARPTRRAGGAEHRGSCRARSPPAAPARLHATPRRAWRSRAPTDTSARMPNRIAPDCGNRRSVRRSTRSIVDRHVVRVIAVLRCSRHLPVG
jgi:hypothetical protein